MPATPDGKPADAGNDADPKPATLSAPAVPSGDSAAKSARASSPFFTGIRIVSGFVGLLLVALGTYYYFYATHEQDYLTTRNLRSLTTMGAQVEGSLASVDQLLRRLDTTWNAAPYIPAYEHLSLEVPYTEWTRPPCARPKRDSAFILALQKTKIVPGWRPVSGGDPSCLERTFAFVPPNARKDAVTERHGRATLNVRSFLTGVLNEPVKRGVLESALLVDTSGLVLAQSGPPELTLRRLNQLFTTAASGASDKKATDKPAIGWNEIRTQPNVIDVPLAGRTYRLFLQPCCLQRGALPDRGLVVAALVDHGAFVKRSLQISLSLVGLVVSLLVLAMTSWPFLKLKLIGAQQRVHVSDILLLALCTLMGTSLCTVVAMDIYAYTEFREELDKQLGALSNEIAAHIQAEVRQVHGQLRQLSTWAVGPSGKEGDSTNLLRRLPPDSFTYPFFESWSLIDVKGMQQRKFSLDSVTQPKVSVKERAYFQVMNERRGWPLDSSPARAGASRDTGAETFMLESVLSWTTGKRQAVLSTTGPTDALRVAAISPEMMSVIDAVVPPSFSYAVIDSSGTVQFHSEKNRNLQERFFAETDMNRSVRSAVFARTRDSLSLKYGGDDYEAYVRPLSGLPWVLVTLRDRDPARVTNLEMVGTSVLLVVIYAVAFLAAGFLHLLLRPGHRVPWLWPDRNARTAYVTLIVVYLLLFGAVATTLYFFRGEALLAAAAVLPLFAVVLTWARLKRRTAAPRPGTLRWLRAPRTLVVLAALAWVGSCLVLESTWYAGGLAFAFTLAATSLALRIGTRVLAPLVRLSARWPARQLYQFAACQLLWLVGVMPATGFFKGAYMIHTKAFVRHGQLRLALDIDARRKRVAQLYSNDLGANKEALRDRRLCKHGEGLETPCELDLYYSSFYRTVVEGKDSLPDSQEQRLDRLRTIREPYEAEGSIERRPLLDYTASDSSWRTAVRDGSLWLQLTPVGGGPRVTLSSAMPSLEPLDWKDVFSLGLIFVLFLPFVVWRIGHFITRRLFLVDLPDSLLIGTAGGGRSSGTNLIFFCDEVTKQERVFHDCKHTSLDLEDQATALKKGYEWVDRLVPAGSTVVVRHFELQQEDTSFNERKLGLLERLVFGRRCAVVVAMTRTGAEPLLARRSDILGPGFGECASEERLNRVLDSFILIDVARDVPHPLDDWRHPEPELAPAVHAARRLLLKEGRNDSHLRQIWTAAREGIENAKDLSAVPTPEELLDHLCERAEPYYETVWATCSRPEQVVLAHLAQDQLANAKDRKILRRLLARGLVRRTPQVELLNETFRQFVLERADAVEAEAERVRTQSLWDAVRWPIMVLMFVSVTFFFVTQQELFSAATAVIMGVATGLPAFARIVGWFADRRIAS